MSTGYSVLEMQRWLGKEFCLCLKTLGSQRKHSKPGEWIIVITCCNDLLGAAGSMPPFQSSHPADHKLSVIAPTCLLAFPFSPPLHKVTSFIYSHMENTGDSNHIRLHPSSSCRKTDASKLQPAHIASRFEMDLRSHKVQIPKPGRFMAWSHWSWSTVNSFQFLNILHSITLAWRSFLPTLLCSPAEPYSSFQNS